MLFLDEIVVLCKKKSKLKTFEGLFKKQGCLWGGSFDCLGPTRQDSLCVNGEQLVYICIYDRERGIDRERERERRKIFRYVMYISYINQKN